MSTRALLLTDVVDSTKLAESLREVGDRRNEGWVLGNLDSLRGTP